MIGQPRKKDGYWWDKAENFLFVLPAVVIFSVFYVYPFFNIFNLSFYEWNGISLGRQFVGLANFKELMTDATWWAAMGNAAYITLIALTFQNALAFALALACDRDIRAKRFYQVVFFIPPVLSGVVVGLVWRWILNSGMQDGEPTGLLNYFLHFVGLDQLIRHWLADPKTALTCIAVVHSWQGFGWGFVILLAGLQTIDRQLYEAARVDGAGAWQSFLNVTVPMLLPVIMVVVILTILGSMQAFILILSMVGQGLVYHTEVPVTRILTSMTVTQRYGYACAEGVCFAVMLMVVSFALKKMSDRMKQA